MRVLVTGGSGFLGSHIVKRLVDEDHDVFVFDSLVTGANTYDGTACFDLAKGGLHQKPRVKFVHGDVRDRSTWGIINSIKFDRIYHCACPASPLHYQNMPLYTLDTGYLGVKNILEFGVEWRTRVLLTSTSEVYGDPMVSPQSESYWGNVNSYGPRAMYDEGKRAGEALAWVFESQFDADVRIARIFNTYGPGMASNDGRMVPAFILAALARKPLPIQGDGTQKRSLCYVDDTVEGLMLLMESNARGPMNIGNPCELMVLAIARVIQEIAGSETPLAFMPAAPDDPRQRQPDIIRARNLLGWDPKVDYRIGLQRTIDWFATPSSR